MKQICSLFLALALILGLCGCGQKAETSAEANAPAWQEQYDLGVRYLSEGNYQEAIIAFTAAIEIDPKRPDAYIGLADAHTARGDTMAAMDVLNQALGAVGENDALSAALEKLRGGPRTRRTDFENGHYLIIEFDDYGNQVRTTQYNADGTLMVETEYDADGNIVRTTDYYDDGTVHVRSYEYDGNVRRTMRVITYGPDGKEQSNQLTEFDADGKEVRVTWYNTDGAARSYMVPEYDAEGKVVRENMYKADGTMTGYWVPEYDADGNTVRRTQYEADGTVYYVEERG